MRDSEIRGNTKTSRDDWLEEARNILIREGVDGVKVDRMARNLGVTRGGFYWFFKNRRQFLDLLLANWQDSRNDPLTRVIRAGDNDAPLETLVRFVMTLIREESYSPALDAAIRDWARSSDTVRRAVELVDNRRIMLLAKLFQALDYDAEEAFIRARIIYFHQVGYYAMDVRENAEQRLRYLPVYFRQLTGFDLPKGCRTR